MFSSSSSADINDDLFKCPHLYGNTSEASELFAHKDRERESVQEREKKESGCVSGT